MFSTIVRERDDGVLVRVRDHDDTEHHVLVSFDGEVLDHDTDDFVPPADRSPELNDVYKQVYNQAFHRVHTDTDYDIVPGPWRPAVIERAIDAVEAASDEQFEQLRPYYEALQDPPIDVPDERVFVVYQPLTFTDGFDGIDEAGPLRYLVETDAGDYEWRGPDRRIDVALHLPQYTFEWPFGDRFREFVVEHLKCQLRDAYVNRGEEPPPEYRVDGFGKINYAGEHLA